MTARKVQWRATSPTAPAETKRTRTKRKVKHVRETEELHVYRAGLAQMIRKLDPELHGPLFAHALCCEAGDDNPLCDRDQHFYGTRAIGAQSAAVAPQYKMSTCSTSTLYRLQPRLLAEGFLTREDPEDSVQDKTGRPRTVKLCDDWRRRSTRSSSLYTLNTAAIELAAQDAQREQVDRKKDRKKDRKGDRLSVLRTCYIGTDVPRTSLPTEAGSSSFRDDEPATAVASGGDLPSQTSVPPGGPPGAGVSGHDLESGSIPPGGDLPDDPSDADAPASNRACSGITTGDQCGAALNDYLHKWWPDCPPADPPLIRKLEAAAKTVPDLGDGKLPFERVLDAILMWLQLSPYDSYDPDQPRKRLDRPAGLISQMLPEMISGYSLTHAAWHKKFDDEPDVEQPAAPSATDAVPSPDPATEAADEPAVQPEDLVGLYLVVEKPPSRFRRRDELRVLEIFEGSQAGTPVPAYRLHFSGRRGGNGVQNDTEATVESVLDAISTDSFVITDPEEL